MKLKPILKIFSKKSNGFLKYFFQNTYIVLNENGTEASGFIIAVLNTNSTGPLFDEEYFMNVNHNFIYMIQSDKIGDIDNNNLLPFIGIVNNLEGEKEEKTEENKNQES